jgi:hypothetical protein
VTLTDFPHDAPALAPLEQAGPEMVNHIRDALFQNEGSRMIAEIMWWVRSTRTGEEFEYYMNSTIMSLLPSARGVHPEDHVRRILELTAEQMRAKMEAAGLQESPLIFIRMMRAQFTLVRDHRAVLLGPPPRPPAEAVGEHGRGMADGNVVVALPREVFRRRCCLKINNMDDYCFRYVMTAWRLGIPTRNAERVSNYLTNTPAGGRLPRGFEPIFIDCGLDFSMLQFPVGISDLEPFETVNDVGVHVYEWHGSQAVLVRRPTVARPTTQEVVLLLDREHWYLVTNIRSFLSGPNQKHQHFCYRCGKVFWGRQIGSQHLEDHLEKISPNSCLENPNDIVLKEYRLPPPEKSILQFNKFEQQLRHPLVIYADFETYTAPANGNKGANSEILTKLTGVASYGYTVVSRIPEIPSRARIVRGSGGDFLNDVMTIAMKYRRLAKTPTPLQWNGVLQEAFEQESQCHLCGAEGVPLIRDHDHFTGDYRGAACQSCNVKAQVPKYVPVFFHNLESFDSHFIVKALSGMIRLAKNEEEVFTDDDDDDAPSDEDDDDEYDELPLEPMEPPTEPMEPPTEPMEPPTEPIDMDSDAIPKFDYRRMRTSMLGTSKEKSMQLQIGPLVFRDSCRLNNCSLGKWINSQRGIDEKPENRKPLAQCFPILRRYHPCMQRVPADKVEEAMDLLLRKVPMAFSRLTSSAYFSLPAVLDKGSYKNDLSGEECTDEDYALIQHIVGYFGLQNQGDYHDLYLYTDILALADVVEAMRDRWYDRYRIDLIHSVTMASASYQTLLKASGAQVELLTEPHRDLMDAILQNIRGGVSCIFQPYAKANNWRCLPKDLPPALQKYRSLHEQVREKEILRGTNKEHIDELLPREYSDWCVVNGYDPRAPTTWIAYVDANSLYPTVMTKPLPIRSFCPVDLPATAEARLELLHTHYLRNYNCENQQGFFVEVTYNVPPALHDFFDYAPVCKRVVEMDELSEYQQELTKKFRKNAPRTPKLFPFLGEQRQVLHHIDLLKYMVEIGVEVTDVHRMWSFQQEAWMASHVREMTNARAESDDPVEKQLLKISVNSLYGKTGQDPLKHRTMKPHYDSETFERAAARSSDFTVFYNNEEDGFFGLTNPPHRKSPLVDTPRAIAFSILELSKLVVLRAHYDFFRKTYGGDIIYKLLMTDTDSLAYLLQTESLSKDLLLSEQVPFDLVAKVLPSVAAVKAAYPEAERPEEIFGVLQKRKGQLGAFKLESGDACITEFVGLAPKMYSMLMRLPDGDLDTIAKGKGVPSAVLKRQTDHDSFRRMLFEPYESNATFKKLQSFKHQMHSLQMTKKMLTSLQDKTYQLSPTESRPLGHWRNSVEDVDDDDEL